MHKCPECGIYTLEDKCPKCSGELKVIYPPKFSIEDTLSPIVIDFSLLHPKNEY